jgi:hypothetical protein
VAERLLLNQPFSMSQNIWDWLGSGVYFWESNPLRGLEFASEAANRDGIENPNPAVVGAIIDMGFCLDLTTTTGLQETEAAFQKLREVLGQAGRPLPRNHQDGRHNLDCAVINYVHHLREEKNPPFDTVRGIFVENPVLYPGSAFGSKNHIQIAVRNPACIKGVFRVPDADLDSAA